MTASTLSPEAQAELANLAIRLAKDEKIGKDVKRRISEMDPTKRFADVESEDLKENIKNEFTKRDQEIAVQRNAERLEAQRNGLVSSGRFKEDDVKEIEKIMEKHGISDYDIAAKVYAADMKPASATSELNSRTWKMPQIKKEDIGNITNSARDKAYDVIDELKRNRR